MLEHPDFRSGEHWQRRCLEAGELVLEEGDAGRDVYLVIAGRLRVLGDVELDEERRIRPGFCDLGPGSVFGELGLFDDQPRSARVETLTEAELAVLDGPRLMAFFEEHPDIGYRVLKELLEVLVGRLRRTNKKLVSLLAWGLKAYQLDPHL